MDDEVASIILGNESQKNNCSPKKLSTKLNQSQREAVIVAVSHPVSLIIGPSGTGKSTTIVNIVENRHLIDKDIKILVTAPSNFAADNLVIPLVKSGLKVC